MLAVIEVVWIVNLNLIKWLLASWFRSFGSRLVPANMFGSSRKSFVAKRHPLARVASQENSRASPAHYIKFVTYIYLLPCSQVATVRWMWKAVWDSHVVSGLLSAKISLLLKRLDRENPTGAQRAMMGMPWWELSVWVSIRELPHAL